MSFAADRCLPRVVLRRCVSQRMMTALQLQLAGISRHQSRKAEMMGLTEGKLTVGRVWWRHTEEGSHHAFDEATVGLLKKAQSLAKCVR